MYAIGCVIGDVTTQWSRVRREHGMTSVEASGTLRSLVGVAGDGSVRAVDVGTDGSTLEHLTGGFVATLGSSDPVMIGGTPYGPESLVAAMVSAVVDLNLAAVGVPADVVAVVHDDDLDPFRSSLLLEATRIAGVPAGGAELVPRSVADHGALEHDGDPFTGAALVALAGRPDDDADDDGDGGGAALAAGAAGLAAGGAVGAGAHLAGDSVASAAAPAAGPTGTPLASTGTPLGSSGPPGVTAGPGGTSMAGPAGVSSGPAGTTVPAGTTPRIPRPRPKWLPAAVVGGAVAVVAVVGVVVLAQGGDDPPAAAVVPTTIEVSGAAPAESIATQPIEPTADTVVSSAPVPETTEPAAAVFDTTALLGEWQGVCEPYLPGDGASTGRYLIEPAGPNQLSLTISGIDFPTVECVGEGETSISQTYSLTLLGETTVEGRAAFAGEADFGEVVIAVEGDTLYLGEGSSFDPSATSTRR